MELHPLQISLPFSRCKYMYSASIMHRYSRNRFTSPAGSLKLQYPVNLVFFFISSKEYLSNSFTGESNGVRFLDIFHGRYFGTQ